MTNKEQNEKFVRIIDAKRRDAGRGFARIDPIIQQQLNLHAGDGIELENPQNQRTTAALVMHGYAEDANTGIIRIDGSLRQNLKAAIDERILIRPIEVQAASSILFAPVERWI